jgi:hypothetical protein
MNFQVESIENVDADVLAVPVLGEEALTALVASAQRVRRPAPCRTPHTI